jgi:hypothetical protein
MATNREELLAEYTRATHLERLVFIEVLVVYWPQPWEPASRWEHVYTLRKPVDEKDILAARKKLLRRRTYFKKCIECEELNLDGHMHDTHVCQGCMSSNHGIVY